MTIIAIIAESVEEAIQIVRLNLIHYARCKDSTPLVNHFDARSRNESTRSCLIDYLYMN